MTCTNCATDLRLIPGSVVIDSMRPFLHCPLCGARIGLVHGEGLYFDAGRGQYSGWDKSPGPGVRPLDCGTLKIKVTVELKTVESCLFDRLVFFRKRSSDPDLPHFTPIRPEYEHLIRECRLEGKTPQHRHYRVITADGYEDPAVIIPGVEVIDPEGKDGTALYLWPNFEVPGWKRYYCAFFTPESPRGRGKIASIYGGRANATGNLAHLHIRGAYAETDFVPESIVMVWVQDDEEYFARYKTQVQVAGCPHLIPLLSQLRAVPELTLGFDFGTTNTAAAVYLVDVQNDNPKLEIRDRTLRLIDGPVNPENTWLPQPAAGEPLKSIPSQIYFQEELSFLNLDESRKAVLDFTIPFYQKQPKGTEGKSKGQFKWSSTLGPHKEKAGLLRFHYFNLALQLLLAEVVGELKIQPQPVVLVATYPLAFGKTDMELHDRTLQAIREPLSSATGFQVIIGDSLDESHASEASGEFIEGAEVTLYIDVGGGTTDVCISQVDKDHRRIIRAVDSIEFGGEDVNLNVEELTQMSPAELRRQIRLRGASVYRDVTSFEQNQSNLRQVRQVIQNFREGLVEIAARFAAAEAVKNPAAQTTLGIMMFGSGWKTIFDSKDTRAMEAELSQAVGSRLNDYHAAGLLLAIPRTLCHYPDDPKSVVPRGAANIAALASLRREHTPGRTYLLEDMHITIERDVNTRPWTDKVPYDFHQRPTRVLVVGTDRFRFNYRLTGLENGGQPLEAVDFTACFSGNVLTHSPFAVYMSRFHRAALRAPRQHG